jgi:hypothetical protein
MGTLGALRTVVIRRLRVEGRSSQESRQAGVGVTFSRGADGSYAVIEVVSAHVINPCWNRASTALYKHTRCLVHACHDSARARIVTMMMMMTPYRGCWGHRPLEDQQHRGEYAWATL